MTLPQSAVTALKEESGEHKRLGGAGEEAQEVKALAAQAWPPDFTLRSHRKVHA